MLGSTLFKLTQVRFGTEFTYYHTEETVNNHCIDVSNLIITRHQNSTYRTAKWKTSREFTRDALHRSKISIPFQVSPFCEKFGSFSSFSNFSSRRIATISIIFLFGIYCSMLLPSFCKLSFMPLFLRLC